MTQHAIALFLDAIHTQVLEGRWGRLQPLTHLDPGLPTVFYWSRLEAKQAGEGRFTGKKRKQKEALVEEETSA